MGGADIGGDESVQWHVEVEHVRKNDKLKHEAKGSNGWLHQGIDEADDGDFTIILKVPSDAGNFLRRVRDAIADCERNNLSTVTFTLPIVGGDHDQIKVRWNSKAVADKK